MLKLDKMKLVTSLNNISNINEDKFSITINKGQVQDYKYSQQEPYNLYIEADMAEKELVIEFTGKILLDRYPELITRDNIRTCLENINAIGVCKLDIDAILRDSNVVKVDVTADIPCSDCKAFTTALHAGVSNHRKYISRRIKDNYVLEKNVQTKNRKLRLSIYDKAKELMLGDNKSFLAVLHTPSTLIQYFQGKVRLELNLNSKEQIRKNLNISSTQLSEVLNSTSSPIMNFLDKAIDDTAAATPVSSLRDYERTAVLRECDNDMEKIEAIVRRYSSPKTHISQVVKSYRELAAATNPTPIKDMLRNVLPQGGFLGIFMSV